VCPHQGRRSRRGTYSPEHVTLAEQVDDPFVLDELDGAGPHDEHRASRLAGVAQDHGAFGVKLDLRRRGDALQPLRLEVVERGMLGQEPDDVHRGQYDARGSAS